MAGKPRLLCAVTDLGYVHVRRALVDDYDLVPAFSMLQARAAVKSADLDAILCSIHFDESRMFELLQFARQSAPEVPFVCCRMLQSPFNGDVVSGIAQSATAQGAIGFIDYRDMQRREGTGAAAEKFRAALNSLLGDPARPETRRRQG